MRTTATFTRNASNNLMLTAWRTSQTWERKTVSACGTLFFFIGTFSYKNMRVKNAQNIRTCYEHTLDAVIIFFSANVHH